jgi:hypothetical protein
MTHDECGMKLIPEYCGGLTKNLELSKLVVIYNYNYNYNYKLINKARTRMGYSYYWY